MRNHAARHRFTHVLFTAGILLCAGLLYAFVCRILHTGVPCPIRMLTGLRCPGCGVTRMCLALLHGNVREAFVQNRAVLLLLPVFAYILTAYIVGYVRRGERLLHGFAKTAAIASVCILLLFGILRNFFGW